MDKSELFDQRVELIKAAANHEEVSHIPLLSMGQTWAIAYYGTTAADALSSPEREFEVYSKHLLDMPFDGTLFFGMNRPLKVYDPLGFNASVISNDGVTLQAKDVALLEDGDVDDFIADPQKTILGAAYRRYPALHGSVENAVAALLQSIQELQKFGAKNASANDYLRKNVGVPYVVGPGLLLAFEKYVFLRGFAVGLTDLRRNPERTLAALEATYSIVEPAPGDPSGYPWRFNPVTTPTYLNRKMFEKFFWPTAKRTYDKIFARGEKACLFMEGSWKHVYDCLLDFPKGSFIAGVESDDFIQTKKDIGEKVVLLGGMDQKLMRDGTLQENLDYTRKIIDECGMSGYIFAPTHGLLSGSDIKAENMKAICEFVRDYRP